MAVNVVRASIVGRFGNGAQTVNDLHYLNTTGGTPPEAYLNGLATDIWTHLGTAYRNVFEASWTADEIVCRTEVIAPDIAVAGSHAIGQVGTYTSSARQLSRGLCATIDKATGFASRSSRGWLMMPGSPIASEMLIDQWASAYVTALQTFASLLDDTITASSDSAAWLPVVYSRTRHKRGDTPYTFDILSATAQNKVHFLRSRLTIP
jgi:hypothetical protein